MNIEILIVSTLLTIALTFVVGIFFKFLVPWILKKLISFLLRYKYRSYSKELKEKSYQTFLNDCDIARKEGLEKEYAFIFGFIFSTKDDTNVTDIKRK